jgi:hypothetical protein
MAAPLTELCAGLVLASQVVQRVFPLRRGLFEDYVANWWCTTSVAVKWKQVRASAAFARVCLTRCAGAGSAC